jgi:Holliday junction resolvase
MSAQNKRKGSKFEIDVMKWFRRKGYNAERLRLSGQKMKVT